MTRWVLGLVFSVLYWGIGLTLWGAFLLADLLGDCLNQATCMHDKPYWLLADFAALCAMVLVYVGGIVFYRRLPSSAASSTNVRRPLALALGWPSLIAGAAQAYFFVSELVQYTAFLHRGGYSWSLGLIAHNPEMIERWAMYLFVAAILFANAWYMFKLGSTANAKVAGETE